MRRDHLLPDKNSHPSLSYNFSRLVPCHHPKQQGQLYIELVQLDLLGLSVDYDILRRHSLDG